MNRDAEHLRLLSIFYYVAAGLAAVGVCICALYFVLGIVLLAKPDVMGPVKDNPDGLEGVPLMIGSSVLGFFALVITASLIFTGRSFSRKKYYPFCLVMAGVSCVFFPLGTVLAVFSLIVLVRPSVKALFDGVVVPPVHPR